MARERNNIYAIAADAVDLTLDTAGTIGSLVGGIASTVGFGDPKKEKTAEQEKQEADDAAERVAASLRQEAEAAKPEPHKRRAAAKHVSKKRATKAVKKAAKPRAARKMAS